MSGRILMSFRDDLAALGYPRLDWIQVGITSSCNAACIYCPHRVYQKAGRCRHMSMKVFSSLSPAFARTGLVYLQGWGEPMLHPEFLTMLNLVKKKGAEAGVTSNATLLTEERIKRLVDQGLDVLSFSVAGVEDRINDQIRPGSPLKQVLKALETVHRVKARAGSPTPRIHLAHMLLASRRRDIAKMARFFNALALDQIVVSTLTLAVSPEMEKEKYPAKSPEDYEQFTKELLDMRSDVDVRDRVFFHLYNPYAPPGACSENIQRSCYVNVEGNILPCVYTDVSGKQPVHKYFLSKKYPLYPLEFGQLSSAALKKIWYGEKYRGFRAGMSKGLCPETCTVCCKRYITDLKKEQ